MPRVPLVYGRKYRVAIEQAFPKLGRTRYKVKSHQTDQYNCIAWAAGQTDAPWWPAHPMSGAHWPDGVPRVATLDAFIRAFGTLGYQPCAEASFELRYEKIALYVDVNGAPTHAARQCHNGRWTSKLGVEVDIEHEFDALAGHDQKEYGQIAQIMKRPAKVNPLRIAYWALHRVRSSLFIGSFRRP